MKRIIILGLIIIGTVVTIVACGGGSSDNSTGKITDTDLTSKTTVNDGAYLPSQCYTKTKSDDGRDVYNPCYSCHTDSVAPNYTNDGDIQLEYAFTEYHNTNHWSNLFLDKSARVAAISDDEILTYIRKSNYLDDDGKIIIAETLQNVPDGWDFDEDGVWDGYIPDCYFNFDTEGFDKTSSGTYTGWRAIAYAPFLGTFWPTNGSTDDVLIRLDEMFRSDTSGNFDLATYKVNLAVVEAMIKRADVGIDSVDESVFGVDLDKDGNIATATEVKYEWDPKNGVVMSFVGAAKTAQDAGTINKPAAGLYPQGTEFLHSVRYIDITDDSIALSARMKELRYAKKKGYMNYGELEEAAHEEIKETNDFPDRLGEYFGDVEKGISNGFGWAYQGFIEDKDGDLRPQTYEETVFCIGCHSNVGAPTDSSYAMPRKYDSDTYQKGWYHWSQKDLKGTPEQKAEYGTAGVQYEYSLYLMYNRGGDEFRANDEVIAKFFNEDGTIKDDMIEALHDDVSILLYPSSERALKLNKAYKTIVEEQSFIYGRDANVTSVEATVHKKLEDKDLETGVTSELNTLDVRSSYSLDNRSADLTNISADLIAEVSGSGMSGPDGKKYGVDWEGRISRSTYSTGNENIHYTFPERLTLPTRFLVANEDGESCYVCHRMEAPVPTAYPQVDVELTLTTSDSTFTEDITITALTNDSAMDTNARWSPDGTKIAWASNVTGQYQIWVMDSDGSNKTQVTTDALIHGWPEWHPDSQTIVFWAHDDANTSYIQTATPAGPGYTITTLLTSAEDINRPVYRPDGNYIAYSAETSDNWDVWVMTADGSTQQRLTTGTDMESNPYWNSDGSVMAYKVAPGGDYSLTIEQFMTFESGFGSPTVQTWSGPQAIQASDWAPDDSKIAYTAEVVSDASGKDRVSYKVMVSDYTVTDGVAGSNDIILSKDYTLGDRGAQFSPDSSKLVFWAWDKNYRATLWLVNSDGTNLQQLTKNGYDTWPMWSPDGTKILFESNRSGNQDLWVMNVN